LVFHSSTIAMMHGPINIRCTFVYLRASQHTVPTLYGGYSGIRYKRNFDITLRDTSFRFSRSNEADFKDLAEQLVLSRNTLVNFSTW